MFTGEELTVKNIAIAIVFLQIVMYDLMISHRNVLI